MKIIIGYPPISTEKGTPLLSQNRQFQYFHHPVFIYPIIPASAATLLSKNNYEVIWKDAIAENIKEKEFFDFLKKENPDLFMFETKTPVIKQHWQIINKIKEELPNIILVIVGDHVTALPEETMLNSNVDYVLTGGDYDFSILELCNYLTKKTKPPKGLWYRENKEIKNTGKFTLCNDLNTLPFIDRDLTKSNLYHVEYNIPIKPFAYIMSGRDCPYHKCKFCAWPVLFPEFRTRSVENVLDEISILIEKQNVKWIFDDTGTFPPGSWLNEFCNGMIQRGYNKKIRFSCNMRVDYITEENAKLMKEAGFELLKIGLESANQETLDYIDKGIKVEQITNACEIAKKAGLALQLTMIVGYPWETKKMAINTLNLAKNLMTSGKADILQSTILVSYPGTQLHAEALKNNWFLFDPSSYERYDMTEPILKTPDMAPKEVMEICNKIYRIFLSPKYILQRIKKIRTFADLWYHVRGAKVVVFGHLRDFSRSTK